MKWFNRSQADSKLTPSQRAIVYKAMNYSLSDFIDDAVAKGVSVNLDRDERVSKDYTGYFTPKGESRAFYLNGCRQSFSEDEFYGIMYNSSRSEGDPSAGLDYTF